MSRHGFWADSTGKIIWRKRLGRNLLRVESMVQTLEIW